MFDNTFNHLGDTQVTHLKMHINNLFAQNKTSRQPTKGLLHNKILITRCHDNKFICCFQAKVQINNLTQKHIYSLYFLSCISHFFQR